MSLSIRSGTEPNIARAQSCGVACVVVVRMNLSA
jgi:hypothetical protein